VAVAALLACLSVCVRAENPVFSVREYGASGDGKALATAAFAKAIEACSAAGGGTVDVPAGTYLTGPIGLRSRVTLHLEPGAVIRGSENLADYQVGRRRRGLLYADGAVDVAITGRGTIDGRGPAFMEMAQTRTATGDLDPRFTRQREAYMDPKFGAADGPVVSRPRPSTLIHFSDCQNVLIADVTLRDAPTWTVHFDTCREATVHAVNILNNPLIPNNDGIHCTNCCNVHISDCEIRGGDDAICVTTQHARGPGFCENVTVSNCTLMSRSAGVRVGYGSNPIRNCTFQNLIIRDSNRGLGVFVRDEESIENILFSNIVIQTRLHTGHWWGNGEPIHVSAIPQKKGAKTGTIRNVTFSNITARGESGIVVYGHERGSIRDLSFRDVRLHVSTSPLNAAYGGNFDLRPAFDLKYAIFEHDIPGFYCRGVDGLRLSDFRLQWDEGLPDFFSHAIACEDFEDVVIDGFEGRQARSNDESAAVWLRNGSTVTVRDSRAAEGTALFLKHEGVQDERLFVNNDLCRARVAMSPEASGFTVSGNRMPR
jgi:hypothetical protein